MRWSATDLSSVFGLRSLWRENESSKEFINFIVRKLSSENINKITFMK
jgi:hypothetical protein